MLEKVLETIVTLALLVFAGVMENSTPGLSQVVVAAVVLRWLGKSPVGEAVADRVRGPKG